MNSINYIKYNLFEASYIAATSGFFFILEYKKFYTAGGWKTKILYRRRRAG